MFTLKQRINHPIFGEGTISDIEERTAPCGAKYPTIITVKFDHPMLTEKEKTLILEHNDPLEYRRFQEHTLEEILK